MSRNSLADTTIASNKVVVKIVVKKIIYFYYRVMPKCPVELCAHDACLIFLLLANPYTIDLYV